MPNAGGPGGPRKMDFFKQSNYRKNNAFQQENLSDLDENPMKMQKFARNPMAMNQMPMPMPMQMRKGKFPNSEMTFNMKQQGFVKQQQQMENNFNPFNNNRMGGFPNQNEQQMDEMSYGFDQKEHQKKCNFFYCFALIFKQK